MSVLQLIDENKQFSHNVDQYFRDVGISKNGLKYHIISVFGSQSTGKSTLLNALFGTRFGVMDERQRGQTTRGIWMGHDSQEMKEPVLILDVEGTDGRERGEDQDFERKAALFALATSEVLIVNMWEHQVGLYQGANMGLLKTVFEVNLSLFQTGRGQHQRSRILFVIRDYMGRTPLENLARTLDEDLERHWESIAKPTEVANSTIKDFFDLEYATLPHKLLQEDLFADGVTKLRNQLVSSSFDPSYHRLVPIDGWGVYAEQIWQQIELNKDLDLPTQQILVARFRCEEIAGQTFTEFQGCIDNLGITFGDSSILVPQFGEVLRKERNTALAQYDQLAGRYHNTVYSEKRIELLGKIDGLLTSYFTAQLVAVKQQAIMKFKEQLTASGKAGELEFKDRTTIASQAAMADFVAQASEAVIDSSFYSYHVQQEELETELAKEEEIARATELRRILTKLSKKIGKRLDFIELHFSQEPLPENPWDAVHETLNAAINDALVSRPPDFGLGGGPEEIQQARIAVNVAAWKILAAKVRDMSKVESVLQRLRDVFEEKFKYTEEGLPVVWNRTDDIEAAAVAARQSALRLLPLYASARLSDGTVLGPTDSVRDAARPADFDDEEEENELDFSELLTLRQVEDIERRFKRQADTAFVEAKRSVMQMTTHIPMYIYVILVVLGWNEFMIVLHNPLLVLLLVVLGGAAYTVYSLGLTDPVLNVLEASISRALAEGKDLLRKYLLEEDKHQQPAKKPVKSPREPENRVGATTVTANGAADSDTD